MTSKSTKVGWTVSAPDYGRGLRGFGVNFLVTDVAQSVVFAETILLAKAAYWNEDFAVIKAGSAEWMLHADHTYSDNPLQGFVTGIDGRGQGAEFHLYDIDPDEAEARARDADCMVLAGCLNKPHGLRECYILDPDGYCWVISRPMTDDEVAELE